MNAKNAKKKKREQTVLDNYLKEFKRIKYFEVFSVQFTKLKILICALYNLGMCQFKHSEKNRYK